MDIIKKDYEISIWDDVIIEGKTYMDEVLVATIGSNIMTSPARALSPFFRENINGTNQLNFTLYTNYYDETLKKKITNPFINLLVNERKIKLKLDKKWYDLIITDIQENSENNSFTYTATDLHINELAKNGFNLEFDNELGNNLGTVDELAEKILEGTDWRLGDSDEIKQYKTEPVYLATLAKDIVFVNLIDSSIKKTVKAGKKIYTFYTAKDKNNFQCIFEEDGSAISTTSSVTKEQYPPYKLADSNNYSNLTINSAVESFQAERLVASAKAGYDSKIDKYYKVYTYNTDTKEYRCFTETEFISPDTVSELMVDGEDFTGVGGWYTDINSQVAYTNVILPEVTSANIKDTTTTFNPYLKVLFSPENSSIRGTLYNTAINVNRSKINSFRIGETYHVLLKGRTVYNNNGVSRDLNTTDIKVSIYKDGKEYIKQNKAEVISGKGILYTIKFDKEITYEDLLSGVYTLGLNSVANKNIYLSKASFFKRVTKKDKQTLIYPEDVLDVEETYVKTYYYIYDSTQEYTSIEDIKFKVVSSSIPENYKEVSNNFIKVRSIAAKESNRYNLLQTLAETFECWIKFDVQHDFETGKILRDSKTNRQLKYISFHNYVNEDYNYSGFKKGVNLTSTNRSLISDQIVSKIIVKNNANEFATDGFCSIARAEENFIRENVAYNFDYYISHNLIDGGKLFADLYNTPGTGRAIGYYTKLREINLAAEPIIEQLSEISVTLASLEAQYQTSSLAYDAALQSLEEKKAELLNFYGVKNYKKLKDSNKLWKNKLFLEDVTQIKVLESTITQYENQKTKIKNSLNSFSTKKTTLEKNLKDFTNEKEVLHNQFFTKYSRYIKEGTWISEDYTNDNLYYLDAEKVLQESAYPKVSYTIQVIDISQLPEFKGYDIKLGEKSFIEDTEFFGWTYQDGLLTPAKEEIIISEITRYLEEPEKNVITVQNYKARFEELFQRITATTQSLQYNSGNYNRVVNAVETTGEIKYETLQNSIANNALVIKNAKDQSVIVGNNGITVTNLSKPNEIVRIVSGGILLSNNGGKTYNSAIRGTGINASYLTAGQINAERINIIAGSFPSFKWDKRGLNAFYFLENDPNDDSITEFNLNKFVRFDRFGLYGGNFGESDEFNPTDIEEIKQKGSFGLTWDGFFLKSKSTENGGIEITSEQDIRVIANDVNRVELGLLDKFENKPSKYGLRLRNNEGKITLETSDEGNLWLTGKLEAEVTNSDNKVGIGTLDIIDDEHGREVINATDKFIVYEDGHMIATSGEFTGIIHAEGGEFTGTINATGGTIGGLEINQINEIAYNVQIIADKTVIKKDSDTITLTAKLFIGTTEITEGLTYRWYKDNVFLTDENQSILIVEGKDFINDVYSYTCKIDYIKD